MKWLKIVVIPLAILAVVLGVVFRLFSWAPLGITAGAYLKLANSLFLIIIVVLLLRIEKKSEMM